MTSCFAIHLTRLVDHAVHRLALGLLLGALVGLLVGGLGWQAGHVGWVFAAPGIGLVVLAVVLMLDSSPSPVLDD